MKDNRQPRIAVIGYFGYYTGKLNGQTVKTRDLYRLISERMGRCDSFDSEDFKHDMLSPFRMLRLVAKSDIIAYLPAHGNLKYIFPIIWLVAKLWRTRIHYFVVGGWLQEYVARLPLHRYMLARIDGIHVETLQLRDGLEQHYGFRNTTVFPNFRFYDLNPTPRQKDGTLKAVFMARVDVKKGLDWIFGLGDYLQTRCVGNVSVTFYGPVNDADREYFNENVDKYSFMDYGGILQPGEIHGTLARYDVMLLPTHYFSEGFMGSVIDAYVAGIPVVVTAWKYHKEFIVDGVSGIVIPFDDGQEALIDAVMDLSRNPDRLRALKAGALSQRILYGPDNAWSMFTDQVLAGERRNNKWKNKTIKIIQ